jgi:hypothetical protein
MSSETSTKARDRRQNGGRQPSRARQAAARDRARPEQAEDTGPEHSEERVPGFQPWHLFLLGSLLASTFAAVMMRGTRPANVVFVCLTVLAAGWAAYMFYRTVQPIVEEGGADVPEMVGGRTRAALEREKTLVLRSIKELEFDRAMGKVSEADCQEMIGRLRARAVRLIRQLDTGSEAYRELIEKELAARLQAGQTAGGDRRETTAGAAVIVALTLGMLSPTSVFAQMGGAGGTGMPDPRAMSGIPLPSETVPAGTVTVRLVRGQLSNAISNHPVEFSVDDRKQTVTTDESGRAALPKVPGGALVKAVAVVDGERLESQEFQMPPQAGVAMLLAATDKGAAAQMAKEAVPGTVRLGGQSRIVTQFDDSELQVFYVLDIVNAGSAPVKTAAPIVFDMPPGAKGTTVIEGSTPLAFARGDQVTVEGPFAPGATSLQIACTLPQSGEATIALKLPIALDQATVVAEKAGDMVLTSAQLPNVRESSDGGKRFLFASGPGLAAGQVLSFDLQGLPHHPVWPRNLALVLAAVILGAGGWAAFRPGGAPGQVRARRQLQARREKLFEEAARLDRQIAAGTPDQGRKAARRGEIVAELEKIYGELDTEAVPRDEQGLVA